MLCYKLNLEHGLTIEVLVLVGCCSIFFKTYKDLISYNHARLGHSTSQEPLFSRRNHAISQAV